MCSNSTSSSGGGCGCETGGNGSAIIWSSGLKKQQKRPRVPKRGPGVAELEKILREEEKKDRAVDRGINAPEGLSPSCFIPHHSNPYNPHPSLKFHPPPPSPPSMTMTPCRMTIPPPASSSSPSHVLLAPKFDQLSSTPQSTMASLDGNGGYNNTALGRNGGGSGFVLAEQAFFPVNPTSCKSTIEGGDGSHSDSGNSSSRNLSSESNPPWSYPAFLQKRHNQYPPPMINQFPGYGTATSSSSLPIGLHNHVEPPSNQSSHYNYSSRAPEEQKVVGIKRPYPSSMDNSLAPPTRFQVSPISSHFGRPHQSSANDSHSARSFGSSNDCYRDAKWGSPLELNGYKFNSENGRAGQKNFPSFGTPTVPSSPMHMFQGELPKANVLPYQVTEERMESYQRSESSGCDHKPFYNFIEVKEQVGMKETTLGSNHEGSEAGSNGLDLTLKL